MVTQATLNRPSRWFESNIHSHLKGGIIIKEDKILTKVCSKCHQEKPLDQYHKNGFDRKGNQKHRGYCKDCANKIEKERYGEKKNFTASFKEKCQKCGETRNYVLDFHHKEREFHFLEKEYNISLDDYLTNNYEIK